jgi:hypothetical protein
MEKEVQWCGRDTVGKQNCSLQVHLKTVIESTKEKQEKNATYSKPCMDVVLILILLIT